MDGFEANEKVIVIAATNRPEVLDRALLRPGRFDRRVTIDLPDRKDREKILKIHGKRKPFAADVKLDIIAARTPGFSGADLFSVMNEAAIFAAREDRKKVSQFDLAEAVDKVSMGPERKSHIMSEEEKQITAYHELGHALIASVTEDADPVNKITIIPRGRAAGVTMTVPDEDRKMRTKNDFLADLDVFMGGYLAEKLIFGDVSTGPSNDLARATDMARDMVTKFGMSDKVGVLTLSNAHKNLTGGEDESTVRYSGKMAELIDSEVSKIMSDAYKRGEKIIKRHEGALHAISKRLLEVETLEREEYEDLLKEHKVPVINRKMKEIRKIKK